MSVGIGMGSGSTQAVCLSLFFSGHSHVGQNFMELPELDALGGKLYLGQGDYLSSWMTFSVKEEGILEEKILVSHLSGSKG